MGIIHITTKKGRYHHQTDRGYTYSDMQVLFMQLLPLRGLQDAPYQSIPLVLEIHMENCYPSKSHTTLLAHIMIGYPHMGLFKEKRLAGAQHVRSLQGT